MEGTLCFKASDGGRQRWSLLPTAVCYVAAFGLIAGVLAIELGAASAA
ncbi:hypothetical protein ABI214_09660 [Prescottella soli]|uniref:Uncharacterized protein n=1 Tax=Prescottella soli TaxID=1543852 RepID=A0ABW9FMZ6_9NOCA